MPCTQEYVLSLFDCNIHQNIEIDNIFPQYILLSITLQYPEQAIQLYQRLHLTFL